jgi:polyhydroxyalkanoate synthesis repressor PhaR
MAYLIKRYANRKLYDTRTKRYLTLDEVAVLVRAGEDVRVEDADSGADLTGHVLSKIIAEGSKKGGSSLVPQKMLVDLIQRPGDMVLDAVRSSYSAGQRTVEQMGAEVGKLIESVAGTGERAKKQVENVGEQLATLFEERLRAVITELGLATRSELTVLERRIDALETAHAKRPAARSSRAAVTAGKKVPARTVTTVARSQNGTGTRKHS